MPKKSLRNTLTDKQITKLTAYGLHNILPLQFEEELLNDSEKSQTGIHYFVVRAVESALFQTNFRFRSSFSDLITKASADANKAQILIQY